LYCDKIEDPEQDKTFVTQYFLGQIKCIYRTKTYVGLIVECLKATIENKTISVTTNFKKLTT